MKPFSVSVFPKDDELFRTDTRVTGNLRQVRLYTPMQVEAKLNWHADSNVAAKMHEFPIVYFDDEASANQYAETVAQKFPNQEVAVSKTVSISTVPLGKVATMAVTEKGVLPR